MYLFSSIVTDDVMKGKEKSVIRKIRMNAGMVDIYLICLSQSEGYFDILNCMQLKQKRFPKEDLYIMGIAKGEDSAKDLAASMYYTFTGIYKDIHFKEQLLSKKEQLFRRC